MTSPQFVSPDEIRTRFSQAMSDMYRQEVPQYGTLLDLVADINAEVLAADPGLKAQLTQAGELERLDLERHGAIRLGTAEELSTIRRVFAVMGMSPVGYYDLSVAGVPVHSTAFRPVTDAALAINPFRVFTSLLRLELIDDPVLRAEAAAILAKRRIFTEQALALTARFESAGGLSSDDADAFVAQALETFRWHSAATVDAETYHRLHQAHRLIADVVCFKGPHINHLTPRTLDIDAAQVAMPTRGIAAKEVVEGPPRRDCAILLRQTSFKALVETIAFQGENTGAPGTHTARFGEIEQRGVALTQAGRTLYDRLLARVRDVGQAGNAGLDYEGRLASVFKEFPDDHGTLRRQGLAYYRYQATEAGLAAAGSALDAVPLDDLIEAGHVVAHPIVYEDFLPVSAAGIFQSNLGGTEQKSYTANAAKSAFEKDLGSQVLDEIGLYDAAERRSIEQVRTQLQGRRPL